MPSRITATVGSPCTENSVNGVPNVERVSFTRGIASEECPCTKSTRFVCSAICLLNSFSFLTPKTIRLAVANSKENMALYPAGSPKRCPERVEGSPDFEREKVPTTGVVDSLTSWHPRGRYSYI